MAVTDHTGPATVLLNAREIPVRVRLMAVHQPVDGRIHWSGRIEADPALHETLCGAGTDVRLTTPGGQADAHVGEPDPWGRYRVSGIGRPPFPLPATPTGGQADGRSRAADDQPPIAKPTRRESAGAIST
jgi:Domain of unknown function (DUF4873)